MTTSETLTNAAAPVPNTIGMIGRSWEGGRTSAAAVDPLFLHRWSPRAFRPEAIPPEHLTSLFEAARWAPSANNEQPWLFVYATRPNDRERFLLPLAPGNRAWAQHAPVLVYLFARRHTSDGEAYPKAEFDTGAAWMSFALQARLLGLDSHPMGGFDPSVAFEVTGVDREAYSAEVAIAVGYRGDPSDLPPPLAIREHPSARRPLAVVAHEGSFAGEGPSVPPPGRS